MSLSITVKQGDSILVPLWFNSLNVDVRVSDSNDDTFAVWATVPTTDTNDSPAFLYAAQDAVGGTTSITLTFSCTQSPCNPADGVPATVFAGALEYQGITHGVDASVTADNLLTEQTQGQEIDSGAFETHVGNELVFGIAMADFGVNPGTGWTARLGCDSSGAAPADSSTGYFCLEEETAADAGSFDATFTTNFNLGQSPSGSAPNGYGISAISIY